MQTVSCGIYPVLLFLGLVALAAGAPEREPVSTIFLHMNVVPMDTDHILRDQSVLVENGVIQAIAKSIPIPKGSRVIDGHGTAFLSPGLADMHTHSETRDDMAVYLANGVTTVLNMGGSSAKLVDLTAPAINSGEIPGPHIYVSFMVDGSPRYSNFVVKTPEEARALVGLAKTNRYDFIKVYNDLSPECFEALVEEGKKLGIMVIGHGVTSVGLEKQLDAGQAMVAHTEEFLYTTFGYPDRRPDPAQIPAAIAFIKRDRAFVTADLITYDTISRQWGKPDVVRTSYTSPEFAICHPIVA